MKAALFLLIVLLCISCYRQAKEKEGDFPETSGDWIARRQISLDTLPVQHISELMPCDILVKPNLNLVPGTTFVGGGYLLGHTAIVIKGAADTNEAALLSRVITFESNARDVPGEYQLRQVAAYVPGNDSRFSNDSFSPDRLGNLYRLRMDLTDAQRDAIIAFVLKHDNDLSHYRACKRFNPDHDSPGNQEYWYCSLLIWQAFYDVLGIDLDANQGYYVYPNDLINSPYFNDEPGKYEKRVRF